jgi:ABC-2 type transport system permease protein
VSAPAVRRAAANGVGGAHMWGLLLAARLRAQMQYRWSFIADVVANFLAMTTEFASIVVVFGHIGRLDGWSLAEVAVLYGSAEFSLASARALFAGFDAVPELIRRGEMDRILTRPRSSFVQALGADLQLRTLGRAAQGLFFLALGLAWLAPEWGLGQWLFGAWTLLGGVLFFGGLFVAGGTLSFWTVESLEAMNILTYGGATMASYPFSIYGRRLRQFFTMVVPLAFVNYYPALLLLDKGPASPWLAAVALPLCAAVLAVAIGFWHAGVRRYASTGS